jgi:carbonic anhydrase
MGRFSEFAFKTAPNFNEAEFRKAFAKAAPIRTVLIYCIDPRVGDIPDVVARQLGEVFPGEIIRDTQGTRVGSTATMATVVVAAGRAVDAMRSISVAEYLFGLENIIVVHHSHCGATSFSADGIIDAYKHEHGSDISHVTDRGSMCIDDFEESLTYDVELIRTNPVTPKEVKISGFFYNIDTGQLTEVVSDPPRTDISPD